jgi:hypothetical protein
MIIELQRALTPEEMYEDTCAICRLPFRCESVIALALTDNCTDMGRACPECIAYLGSRNPAAFPFSEEYEAAKRRYPAPIWASADQLAQAEDGGTFEEAYGASFLRRTVAPSVADAAVMRALKHSDAFNDAQAVVEDTPRERLRRKG